jgi:hypothetical protein
VTQKYALAIPIMYQCTYFEKKITAIQSLAYCGINELLLREISF